MHVEKCTQVLRIIKHHKGAPFLAFYRSFALCLIQVTQYLLSLKIQTTKHLNTNFDIDYHGNGFQVSPNTYL